MLLDFFFFLLVLGFSLGVSDPLSLFHLKDDKEAVLPILPLKFSKKYLLIYNSKLKYVWEKRILMAFIRGNDEVANK